MSVEVQDDWLIPKRVRRCISLVDWVLLAIVNLSLWFPQRFPRTLMAPFWIFGLVFYVLWCAFQTANWRVYSRRIREAEERERRVLFAARPPTIVTSTGPTMTEPCSSMPTTCIPEDAR